MKRKTALITGICGQDGSYIADLLLEKEYNVVGIMRRNATCDLGNAKHLEGQVDIIEGDITDMSSMLRIIQQVRPHEIYNMAAMSHVHTSFEQPLATIDIDTKGVVNILESVRGLGYTTRILHASTSEMFGASPPPQSLETVLKPQSPYAIAKVASHHFVRLYREAYKMYCCSAVTFNHECFSFDTPVIIKKGEEIDIVYVGSLIPNRKDISKDSSTLTKEYEGMGIEIWDGEEFVELKAVSRKKLFNLQKEENRKIQITNSPIGLVSTTPNHKLMDEFYEKRPASSFLEGQKLLAGKFPTINYSKISNCVFAKFLGLLCGDGHINKNSIRLTNNSKTIRDEFISCAKLLFCNVGYRTSEYQSGFGGLTTHVDINGLSSAQCILIKEMLYDGKTKHKKVPATILNATQDVQLSFLKGYNLTDGLKAGNEQYEFASFKTNSPLLAQGLLFLINNVTKQSFNINAFEQRGNVYYQINLHSDNNPHKYGAHLKKDPCVVKKFITREEDNQHVFDIETASGKVMAGIGTLIVGNSERRGPNFVTRKITMGVARCLKDSEFKLKLGNLDAQRDWGYAPDFVRGFHLALQHETPGDYIFATGKTHSVKEFCELAFSHVGLNWENHIEVDRFYMRPAEVDALQGDFSQTKEILGWEPTISFEELVKGMVDYDCELLGVNK